MDSEYIDLNNSALDEAYDTIDDLRDEIFHLAAALKPFADFGELVKTSNRKGLSELLYSWDGREDIGIRKTDLIRAFDVIQGKYE